MAHGFNYLTGAVTIRAACPQGLRDGLGSFYQDPNNAAWLVYNRDSNSDGSLDPFFLIGPGDPEGLLYEGQRSPDGTRSGGRQDEIINRIIAEGGNSVYVHMVRSHGGDGDDSQNPFVDSSPALRYHMRAFSGSGSTISPCS